MAETEIPEGEVSETPDVIEDNKSANTIASMLWVWKWVNRERLKYETNEDSIFIKFPGDIGVKFMGGFLETSGEDLINTIKTIRYYYVTTPDRGFDRSSSPIDPTFSAETAPFKEELKTFDNKATYKDLEDYKKILVDGIKGKNGGVDYFETQTEGNRGTVYEYSYIGVEYEKIGSVTLKTESPIKNFNKEDACWIKSEPTQYYLRFGALLTYIKTDIIPKIDNTESDHQKKPPMFNVNFQPYTNYMYVLPNSISLDPRVCIVRNDNFRKTAGDVEVFKNLQPFRAVDYGNPNPNKAYIMNIYLNFNFIIESLNSNTDERGDISVFEFLKVKLF